MAVNTKYVLLVVTNVAVLEIRNTSNALDIGNTFKKFKTKRMLIENLKGFTLQKDSVIVQTIAEKVVFYHLGSNKALEAINLIKQIEGKLSTEKSNQFVPHEERDERFEEAARLIVSTGLGSTSLLQKRLKLGFAQAGRLMDQLHEAGIVGPPEGSRGEKYLLTPNNWRIY